MTTTTRQLEPSMVLVTGATGRVGTRLVDRLLQQRSHVRAVVRDEQSAAALADRGVDVVVGDLRDPDAVARAVHGVAAIVHLAAAFRGVEAAEANAVNLDVAVSIGRAAVDGRVGRFVYVSTTLVYGPGRGRPLNEDDDLQPSGYGGYPAAKAAAEGALLALHVLHGLPLRIVRLAFVYGDGDPHLTESLTWARQWPAHQRLQLIHHADVAQGIIRPVHTPGIDGRSYNIGDDAPVTAHDLLHLAGEEVDAEAAGRRLADPWEGILDTARARSELGWRPIYPTLETARAAGAL